MSELKEVTAELARVRAELEKINEREENEARWRSWHRRIMNAGVNHTGLRGYALRDYERKQYERECRLRGDNEEPIF
jgi:hypothetical protein